MKKLFGMVLTGVCVAAAVGISAGSTFAISTQYWDGGDSTTPATGGTGVWNASNTNWNANANPSTAAADLAWTAGNDGVFSYNGGSVDLQSTQSLDALTFNTTGFNIGSTNGSTLNFGTSNSVTVTNPWDYAIISAQVSGTNGLYKKGYGTLYLTNSTNNFTGTAVPGRYTANLTVACANGSLGATGSGNSYTVCGGAPVYLAGGINYTDNKYIKVNTATNSVTTVFGNYYGNNSFSGTLDESGTDAVNFSALYDTLTFIGTISQPATPKVVMADIGRGSIDIQTAVNLNQTAIWNGTPITACTVSLSGANGVLTGDFFSKGFGAVLALDNRQAANSNRIGDTNKIWTTEGGMLRCIGNANTAITETVASLGMDTHYASGQAIWELDSVGANFTLLTTAADFSRGNNDAEGTVLLRGTNLGTDTNLKVTGTPTKVVGGTGGAGTTTRKILPFMIGDTRGVSGTGNSFVTYDAAKGCVPLNLGTEYQAGIAGATANTNVRVTAGEAVGSATSLNDLLGDSNSTMNVTGSGALTVQSGAVANVGAGDLVIANPITFGSTGTAEGVVFATGSGKLTLNGALTTTGNFTKGGTGTVVLNNTTNSFGATRVVDAGVLQVTADRALGTTAGNTWVYPNAALELNNVNYTGAEYLQIYGDGINHTGGLRATGTNSFVGGVGLGRGRDVNGWQALGTISIPGVNDTLTLTSTSAIGAANTAGGIAAFGGGGDGFNKTGAGNLIFTGASQLYLKEGTGVVYLTGGTITLRDNATFNLSDGSNGADVITYWKSLFAVDQSNNPKTPPATAVRRFDRLFMYGGEFKVTGSSLGNTIDQVYSHATVTNYAFTACQGMGTVTVAPGSGYNSMLDINGASATYGKITQTAGGQALFRGTSLGVNSIASQTANSANIQIVGVNNASNGIVPWALVDTSATGTGADFMSAGTAGTAADCNTTYGIHAYTGYVAPTSSATANIITPSGTTTITGNTAWNSGKLVDGTSLNGTGTLYLTSGALLFPGSATVGNTGGVVFGTTGLAMAEGRIYTTGSAATVNVNAPITGGVNSTTLDGISTLVALDKGGQGTLALNNASPNLFGNVYVNQGTLKLGTTGAIPNSSLVFVAPGATLDVNGQSQTIGNLGGGGTVSLGSGTLTIASADGTGLGSNVANNGGYMQTTYMINGMGLNPFTGSITGTGGSLVKVGPGLANLAGANSYTGSTTVRGGVLGLYGGGSLSSSTALHIEDQTGLGAMFDLAGQSQTVASLNSAGGTSALNYVTNSMPQTTSTLTVTGGGQFDGVIHDGGKVNYSVVAMTLSGGTLKLGGANTYTGPTTVTGGALLVNGSTAAESAVSVTGGTLGGIGTVNGPVSISGLGHLAPGQSVGMLSTGSLSLSDCATFDVEISGASSDCVSVTGSVALGSGLGTILTISAASPLGGALYFIINNDGTDPVTGELDYGGTTLAQGATFSDGTNTWKIGYTGDSAGNTFTGGNDVVLQLQAGAAPEPGTLLLLGTGLLGGLGLLRRRLMK